MRHLALALVSSEEPQEHYVLRLQEHASFSQKTRRKCRSGPTLARHELNWHILCREDCT